MFLMRSCFAFLLLSCMAAVAQYPGQYPPPAPGTYPPGEYPPGQYPPGYPGGGVSVPSRSKKKQQKQNEVAQPPFSAEGMTVSNDGKKLVIATMDGRLITMTLTPQTKITRGAAAIAGNLVVPRTTVHIEALQDDEFFLTAMNVNLLKDAVPEAAMPAGTRAPGAPAEEDLPRPTILTNSPDAPDRPILRHVKPGAATTEPMSASTRPALTLDAPSSTILAANFYNAPVTTQYLILHIMRQLYRDPRRPH